MVSRRITGGLHDFVDSGEEIDDEEEERKYQDWLERNPEIKKQRQRQKKFANQIKLKTTQDSTLLFLTIVAIIIVVIIIVIANFIFGRL